MATYKYLLNGYEYNPVNTGDFTHEYNLEQESGFYQFVYSINGAIAFGNDAYTFIERHGDCEKISLQIIEKTSLGEFTLFNGYFTNRDCKFSPDDRIIEVEPTEDTIYQCIKDNWDVKFNFLESSNIVTSIYEDTPKFEFQVILWGAPDIPDLPFYGSYIERFGGGSPFLGFASYVRETVTTYCRGGELQAPTGSGWELLLNECSSKNTATWFRKPPIFQNPPTLLFSDFTTTNSILPALPPYPPTPSNENWLLMDTLELGAGAISFWVDYDKIRDDQTEFLNGRDLLSSLNFGLNYINCAEVDIQSRLLNDDVNPVNLESPNTLKDIQLHAISDIKSPLADIKATVEKTTLKEISEGYLYGKLNCRLRADEKTKKLIIEHVSNILSNQVYNIASAQGLNNKFEYDNSDIPTAEEFPSLDTGIDFTGVDIRYFNPCAKDVKAYQTDKFYSEIEFIIDSPEEYPNDGIVFITPLSLAAQQNPDGLGIASENGAITGDYYPNMPQGQANLHQKFWRWFRPFPEGQLNFKNAIFTQNRPVKKLESVIVPLCDLGGSFFLFDPYGIFIGNKFNEGYLQSASFNEATKEVTLEIQYYE